MDRQRLAYILFLSQWSGTTKDLLMSTEAQSSILRDHEVFDPHGELIDIGVIDSWQNEADGLKNDQDALNEFYRQFPRTTEHALEMKQKTVYLT